MRYLLLLALLGGTATLIGLLWAGLGRLFGGMQHGVPQSADSSGRDEVDDLVELDIASDGRFDGRIGDRWDG